MLSTYRKNRSRFDRHTKRRYYELIESAARSLKAIDIDRNGWLDLVVTDDRAQAGTEGLAYEEPYDGEVADLVVGRLAARQDQEQRTALVFAGLGLADVAVAGAVYEQAKRAGVGQRLPL